MNLPTFFAVGAPGSGQATVGGQGYTLRIQVAASTYNWQFGDGAAVDTTDAGGPPPAGGVHHAYAQAGSDAVQVTVSYGATYTVITPYGDFGPQVVPGGAVRTLPAQLPLQVDEAHAGLIS